MNERIKQLAEQAKITFTDYGSGEFLTEDDISLPRLENFAELIVAECTKAVRDGTWEGDNYAARVEGVFGINHPTITFRDVE